MLFRMYIGLPGSGKSTKAREFCKELRKKNVPTICISSDLIREEIYGDANVQKNPGKVFEIAHKRIFEALDNKVSVVFDATNLSSRRRKNLVRQIQQKYPRVLTDAEVVVASLETCIARQVFRERSVPFHAIMKMAKSFQVPLFSEGWDMIGISNTDDHKTTNYEYFQSLIKDYDQQNPHHELTLDKHSQTVGRLFQHGRFRNDLAQKIGECHDIGKYYTCTTDEDNIAHYFGHANVSAWQFLSTRHSATYVYDVDYDFDSFYTAAVVINYHMDMLFRDEKGLDKLREQVGNNVYGQLVFFSTCDELGSKIEYAENR